MRYIVIFFLCISVHGQSLAELEALRGQQITVDPILSITGLDAYLNKASLDPSATVDGNSLSGGWAAATGTSLGATTILGTAPVLNIASGNREAQYNNTGSFSFGVQAALDYIPGTDTFYIAFKIGETNLLNGCIVCKSTTTTATRQYQIEATATNTLTIYIGGINVLIGTITLAPFDVIIVQVSPTLVNVWKNGTQVATDISSTGTGTNTQATDIGSRQTGLYLDSGTLRGVLMGKATLTAGERTIINDNL